MALFHYQKIKTDIGNKAIGYICNQYKAGKSINVYCINFKTNKMELKPILGIIPTPYTGVKRLFMGYRSNPCQTAPSIYLTPDQSIFTAKGFMPLESIDCPIAVFQKNYSDIQRSLIVGSLISKSCYIFENLVARSTIFRFISLDEEYLKVKRDMLYPFCVSAIAHSTKGNTASPSPFMFTIKVTPFMEHLYKNYNKGNLKDDFFEYFNEFSLAVWYMDKALPPLKNSTYESVFRFDTSMYTRKTNRKIKSFLKERFDLDFDQRTFSKPFSLTAKRDTAIKLCNMISPYVLPSHRDKLLPDTKGEYSFDWEPGDTHPFSYLPINTLSDYEPPLRELSANTFNLIVADNFNYLTSNHFIVKGEVDV